MKRLDMVVRGRGSLFLLRAVSRRGARWIDERISNARREWAGAVVVEHRYITDIIRGAIGDGLRVR